MSVQCLATNGASIQHTLVPKAQESWEKKKWKYFKSQKDKNRVSWTWQVYWYDYELTKAVVSTQASQISRK